MSAIPQQPMTWMPQQAQPVIQPTMPMRRVNWVTIVGATFILVGLILAGVAWFALATPTSLYDDMRWIHAVMGAGMVMEGVGMFLAFPGLATVRRT